MLSRRLEETLHRSLEYATERKHKYATLEHLLLALIEDDDARQALEACAVNLGRLRGDVLEFLDNELESLLTEESVGPAPTAGFQRVVQRSVIHVQSSGHEEVTGANVLIALFSEHESHAVYSLQVQDLSDSTLSTILHMDIKKSRNISTVGIADGL